jgi:hypothetical protein
MENPSRTFKAAFARSRKHDDHVAGSVLGLGSTLTDRITKYAARHLIRNSPNVTIDKSFRMRIMCAAKEDLSRRKSTLNQHRWTIFV